VDTQIDVNMRPIAIGSMQARVWSIYVVASIALIATVYIYIYVANHISKLVTNLPEGLVALGSLLYIYIYIYIYMLIYNYIDLDLE
jgi:hypothetical protein